MQAIVTRAFSGVRDGQVWPEQFEPGAKIEGDLAALAVAEGWATPAKETKVKGPAPETKAGG